MDFKTDLAGLELEHPIFNAAGTCKMLDGDHGVRDLAKTPTAAIMLGSITYDDRMGNTGDVYHFDPERRFSLNSLGLPCRGWRYYQEQLPEMARICSGEGKPLIVSVAGFTPQQFADLAELAFTGGADMVELNLGCPNIWDGGKQKQIFSFSPQLVFETLVLVTKKTGEKAKVSIKVSPFSDPTGIVELAKTVIPFPLVKAVVTTNTFPNCFAYSEKHPGAPMITVGYAGFAGPAMKPIGMGQVRQWRTALPEKIQIIGVGGVCNGQDVLDYQLTGAVAVQTATTFLQEGPAVFSRLLTEMAELSP